MKMLKWLVLFVFSLSFITGCSQNEVKTDKKTAAKQTEQKDENKQEQKQQSSEEQKQEEKPQEEKAADSKSIEQNQEQKQNAEQSQNQEQKQNAEQPQNQEKKTQSQEKSKVVNEPKETPKQENIQQAQANPVPAPEPKPEPKPEPRQEIKTVTLSVRDDQSTILGGTEVELQEGDTVFKVLARTMKQKGIQMEYTGSGSSIYVRGINNLYEKDKGDLSGWMYRVNGVVINESAGRHKVKQGDKVEWLYTKDSGKDIGK